MRAGTLCSPSCSPHKTELLNRGESEVESLAALWGGQTLRLTLNFELRFSKEYWRAAAPACTVRTSPCSLAHLNFSLDLAELAVASEPRVGSSRDATTFHQ